MQRMISSHNLNLLNSNQWGNPHPVNNLQVNNRLGATLIEILLAMFIMAVGVTMIAAIFPLSVRQSLEATRMTNATLYSYQAAALLKTNSSVIPDHTVFGIRGAVNPAVANINDVRVTVVDPLGQTILAKDFGNNNGTADASSAVRGNGGVTNWASAQNLMVSRDAWAAEWSDQEVSVNGARTEITFSAPSIPKFEDLKTGNTLINNATAPRFNILGRLEIISDDGLSSQVRIFDKADIAGTYDKVTLSTPLPATNYSNPREVRSQILEPRYSWMLTTRSQLLGRGDDNTVATADDIYVVEGDIVVFFRRPFTDLNEQRYAVTAGTNPEDLNLSWASADQKPTIKPGVFIFDPANGNWYRISAVTSLDDTARTASVVLNKAIQGNFPANVIFQEAVVEVYPWRKRSS